jgi:hypothetical protein
MQGTGRITVPDRQALDADLDPTTRRNDTDPIESGPIILLLKRRGKWLPTPPRPVS